MIAAFRSSVLTLGLLGLSAVGCKAKSVSESADSGIAPQVENSSSRDASVLPPPNSKPSLANRSSDGALRVCDLLAQIPKDTSSSPLPQDLELAAWTVHVESAFEPLLGLRALIEPLGKRVSEETIQCAGLLYERLKNAPSPQVQYTAGFLMYRLEQVRNLKGTQPEFEEIIRKTHVPTSLKFAHALHDESKCRSTKAFLAGVANNARLHRALLLSFNPCVEDNFNSIDGELDVTEPLFRLTAETWPRHLPVLFELLSELDGLHTLRQAWRGPSFSRILLDLGVTGNALRVVDEVVKAYPDQREPLRAIAERWAAREDEPLQRRARWRALVALLRDTTAHAFSDLAAITRLSADAETVRWSLAAIPNQLLEQAPNPYPWLSNPALIRALEQAIPKLQDDQDKLLMIDVLAKAKIGTGVTWLVAQTGSPKRELKLAALSALHRQSSQAPGGVATLLGSSHSLLHDNLAASLCDVPAALDVLVELRDPSLDRPVSECLRSSHVEDATVIQSINAACMQARTPWPNTAKRLKDLATGAEKGYALRTARECDHFTP
jgi:hypothetical protein